MSTELSSAQWQEIEQSAVLRDGRKYIAVPELRNILRKSRRSTDQNALLWSLYDDILKKGGETLGGWNKDDLHEYCLGEYFGWTKHEAFGRTRLKPNRRSSRLTKAEFADFVEWIVRKMAGFGILLELPGERVA